MPSQNDIRQSITDQIIAALESGNVPPWRRPWRLGKNGGAHANVVSKRSYRGLNPILLDLASETHGFSSKWWATFNQWKGLGGRVMPRPSHVPPGKWGTQIVFWSPVTKKVENDQGDLEDDKLFVLRLYSVFNIDQVVEGTHLDNLRAGQPTLVSPSPLITNPQKMPSWRPGLTSDSAAARRFTALLATSSKFRTRRLSSRLDEFYGTCFHELCHWSEQPSRLNWSRKKKDNTYQLANWSQRSAPATSAVSWAYRRPTT